MSKKIISFSLFGNDDIYCVGAIENARLSSLIYEGWVCRFYIDEDVPKNVVDELKKYNSEIILNKKIGKYDGLFWRFKPFYDNDVSIWVSRDCDSRINHREKVCVDEWINSDKSVHIIRDSVNHSYEIMAGMFGVNNEIFKQRHKIPNLIINNSNNLTDDQRILLENLWPIIENDHLSHDFWYNNQPTGQPTYESSDEIHFNEAYGCGLVNYILVERSIRHKNLFINKDIRNIPKHKKIDYGIFVGQKIDENNQPIFSMDCRWEYELRGLKK